jgi:ACS family tartrate transporter-like MFS transporter
MAAAPLSTALGSPISAALLEMHGLMGFAGWQWMFVLEAIPALLLGIVVLFWLTDRPAKAKWLTEEERTWLQNSLQAEEQARATGQSHTSAWRGLADKRVLALALVYFGTSAGLYTLGIWAPQIIHSFGASSLEIGFLNAFPAVAGVLGMILWARHSDRTRERSWHVIAACLLAAAGLIYAGSVTTLFSVIIALTLVTVGISASKPPLWSMPTLFLSGPAAAAGIAAINSIGNLGGFVGPMMIGIIRQQTGSYTGGLYFVAGLLLISALTVLILSGKAKKPQTTELHQPHTH